MSATATHEVIRAFDALARAEQKVVAAHVFEVMLKAVSEKEKQAVRVTLVLTDNGVAVEESSDEGNKAS